MTLLFQINFKIRHVGRKWWMRIALILLHFISLLFSEAIKLIQLSRLFHLPVWHDRHTKNVVMHISYIIYSSQVKSSGYYFRNWLSKQTRRYITGHEVFCRGGSPGPIHQYFPLYAPVIIVGALLCSMCHSSMRISWCIIFSENWSTLKCMYGIRKSHKLTS